MIPGRGHGILYLSFLVCKSQAISLCSEKAHGALGTTGMFILLPFHDGYGERSISHAEPQNCVERQQPLERVTAIKREHLWARGMKFKPKTVNLPDPLLHKLSQVDRGSTGRGTRETSSSCDWASEQAPQLSPWIHFRESTTQISNPRLLSGSQAGFQLTLASHSHQTNKQASGQWHKKPCIPPHLKADVRTGIFCKWISFMVKLKEDSSSNSPSHESWSVQGFSRSSLFEHKFPPSCLASDSREERLCFLSL